jgi:hypothetical protein
MDTTPSIGPSCGRNSIATGANFGLTSASSRPIGSWLHRNARAYAEQEGVSVNQLIAAALAEELAALGAQDFLASRVARGSRSAFDQAWRR